MDSQPSPPKTKIKLKKSTKWTLGAIGLFAFISIIGGGGDSENPVEPVDTILPVVEDSVQGEVLGDSIEVALDVVEELPLANEGVSEPVETAVTEPESVPIIIPEPDPIPIVPAVVEPEPEPVAPSNAFSCSVKKTCGDMVSCDEAYFYLNTCGDTARDNDKDGVPCEKICTEG